MTSSVFYRKWRPQTFSQVVGQDHVSTTLRHAVASGRVAHAYIFTGPRGTGKTSSGRILAKAVNCLQPQDGEPCDSCPPCQAVAEGRALDLVEIDAASHRGIDEVRDLREKVRFAPYEGKYKVYIIDEVHMLTEPAFNALLKTLEEPPPQIIFVLATTESHRVPATILSRCQRFDFRRIAEAAVVQRLAQLCQQEGIDLEDAGLRLIARSAGGSLRDAENLLEQLTVGYGPQLTTQQVTEVLGTATDERSREVARLLLRKELPQALVLLNQAHEEGVDLRQFRRGLVDYLRGVMLLQAGAEGAVAQEAAVIAEMRALAQATPPGEVVRAVKAMVGLSLSPEEPTPLPLELALAEAILPQGPSTERPKVAERPARARGEGRAVDTVPPVAAPPPAPAPPRVSAPPPRPGREPAPEVPPPPQPEPPRHIQAPAEPPVPADSGPLGVLKLRWRQVIEATRGKGKGSLALDALLRSSCELVRLEDNTLVLGFAYPALQEKMEKALEDPPTRKALEDVLTQVAGQPLRVSCILVPREKKPLGDTGGPASPPSHLVREAMALGARPVEDEKP